MKILIVGFGDSVHIANWIKAIPRSEHQVHFYPFEDLVDYHPDLVDLSVHTEFYSPQHAGGRGRKIAGLPLPGAWLTKSMISRRRGDPSFFERRAAHLANVLDRLRPELVHSHEIQSCSRLVLSALSKASYKPKWWVSNWGSDISLFGRFPKSRDQIEAVLRRVDYYSSESQRDDLLATRLGFKGRILERTPFCSGVPVSEDGPGSPPHLRKVIALKGYQGWAGRSLFGLRALELIADHIRGYEIVVYSCDPSLEPYIDLLVEERGMRITKITGQVARDQILELHKRSRVSIGLSLSDGISSSVLEAMAMGSIPIQSDSSAADEWIEDGKTGYLVNCHDVGAISDAVLKVLTRQDLEFAQRSNWQKIVESASLGIVAKTIAENYRAIAVNR